MKDSKQSQPSYSAFSPSSLEPSSIGKLKKMYSLFFESADVVSSANIEFKKHIANGIIPLHVLKEQAKEIEKTIGVLGSITLTLEPSPDKIAIIQEIQQKLHITEPDEINYLENRIHNLVAEISACCNDKNLNFCLNHLKEKAWNLLEVLIEYAKKEYNSTLDL